MKEKNCKIHGLLSEKDISITNKKYLRCKLCKKETDKMWKKNNPERAKYLTKEWAKNNRDKMKESDKKWKINNIEKVKEAKKKYIKLYTEKNNTRGQKHRNELADFYVARTLSTLLKTKEIPMELIEAKRLLMKLKRKLKEKT